MDLYFDEIIGPSLWGTKHWKIFNIWGGDFAFSDAEFGYRYITTLRDIFSNHSEEVWNWKVTFKFSTVQEYFDDVKALNLQFPQFHGDFMPYIELSDGTFDHWVGYYSSTPTLKKMIRDMFSQIWALKMKIFSALCKEQTYGFFELDLSLLV